MNFVDLVIARLRLRLDLGVADSAITFPTAQIMFLQPAMDSQAGFNFKKSSDTLHLRFESPLLDIPGEKYLARLPTWEFGEDGLGRLIFSSPYQMPPCKVLVEPDFTNGLILYDVSQLIQKDYPLDILEVIIYSAWLATFGDLIFHASGIALNGRGYCFVGESGAGKSTLVSAFADDSSVTVLGEDNVILRYLDGRFWIFGSPWHWNPSMCSPLGVPLEKIFFLDRSASPGVEVLKPARGVTRLLQTAFIPYYFQEYMPGILDRLSLLSERIPYYSLSYQLGTDPSQHL